MICQILSAQVITNQEQLTRALRKQGMAVTQATLSRDLRDLKAEKKVMQDGKSKYVVPPDASVEQRVLGIDSHLAKMSIRSVDFCGVVKTRPGFANALAYDIDTRGQHLVLGTIAGDDTILVIPREEVARDVLEAFLQAR